MNVQLIIPREFCNAIILYMIASKEKTDKNLKIVIPIICIGLICLWLSVFVVQIIFVDGDSMAPTYKNKQMVLINKIDKEYDVGEVIVFTSESVDGYIIKRISAGPGDSVIIEGEETILQAGEYYVLGDNREHSIDSRNQLIGIVREENIIGKVI